MTEEPVSNTVSQSWQRPLQPPAEIPQRVDVVIIGGGIVGVSTAWFLAKRGLKVALCEKGHIAGEQSGRNWGWVRQQGRDPREMPMIVEALKIWRRFEAETGEDVGFHQAGCLFAAREQRDLERFETWLPVAKEFGLDTRMLDATELGKLVQGAGNRWLGGIHTPGDGYAEPHKASAAIARTASRLGTSILTACAVRGVETEAGRVSAVVTEHGTIKTGMVLCAAGAWTSMFCRSLGITVPQLRVRGTVARTAAAEPLLETALFDAKLGIRRRQDGGYTVAHGSILDHGITPSTLRFAFKFMPALMQEIKVVRLRLGRDFMDELSMPRRWPLDQVSPFEDNRVLDPAPSPRVLKEIRKNLDQTFPQLAGIGIVESWAGMVETSPDVVPIIGEEEALPGFFVATGFSGHGFGIGPGAGKAIADLLTNEDNRIDLTPFRRSRFFDGSKIRPQRSV